MSASAFHISVGPLAAGRQRLRSYWNLFHAYILKRNTRASVSPYSPGHGTHLSQDKTLDARLRSIDTAYHPLPRVITYLHFDDGRDSYRDEFLSSRVFMIRSIIIIASSYFAVMAAHHIVPVYHEVGTVLCLSDAARVDCDPQRQLLLSVGV